MSGLTDPYYNPSTMASQVTFTQLKQSLKAGHFAPFYFLYGEEGYFIDEAVKVIEQILPEADRDFNQYVFYAPQVSPDTVIDACRRYPMMCDRQIVLVKETQAAGAGNGFLNALLPYLENPNPATILAVVFRGEDLDPKKNKFLKEVLGKGIDGETMASKRLRGNAIGTAIKNLVTDRGLSVEPKALAMLEQFVGADLSRIYNEIDKMTVALPPGAMVTPESIERYIGISKDYNTFELRSALARRDASATFAIIDYFRRNPKNCPVPPAISTIFGLFSDLLIAIYTPDKSERGLMEAFKVRYAIQVQDTLTGLRNYRPWQVIQIIDAIRRTDAMTKGIGSRLDPYDLLQQLAFTILTCPGASPV